jgi:cellulose synthase/poly-beta-1,6-N-acetylglucosamine synthase-like glycosyltransferase
VAPRRWLRWQRLPDRATLLQRAVWGLAERYPAFSGRRVLTRGQTAVIAIITAILAAAVLAWPDRAAHVAVAAMSLMFLYSLSLRTTLALIGRSPLPVAPIADAELPVYTILVPVYREAGMIPQLTRALAALDYPAAKRDVWLVVEEDDDATRLAVRAAGLRAISVPVAVPRTKPKACNYALPLARGEYLVVYDAEDRPEPDQLRKAAAAFRDNPDVSCFQARLAIDRPPSWVARMFLVDYALWFRTLLPGLARLKAPIPLGGTSNHFRTAALIAAGAWDPFNVTEDADLGLRLARLGHRVAILDSSTFEEAPPRLGVWLRQRTRWMKGYMQTLLVHTREPGVLLRQIGVPGVLLSLSFLGGAVWSALINPLLWIVCLCGLFFADQDGGTLAWLARLSGIALLIANGMLAVLAALKGGWRGRGGLIIVLTYPLYWLLISAATYRALWQLLRDPFRWEKTPHGSAPL